MHIVESLRRTGKLLLRYSGECRAWRDLRVNPVPFWNNNGSILKPAGQL